MNRYAIHGAAIKAGREEMREYVIHLIDKKIRLYEEEANSIYNGKQKKRLEEKVSVLQDLKKEIAQGVIE